MGRLRLRLSILAKCSEREPASNGGHDRNFHASTPEMPMTDLFKPLTLAAAIAIGLFFAAPAAAQTRAVPVRNVDEPGRNPYQGWVSFDASRASGDGFFCQLPPNPPVCNAIYATVPAGKRLVVENITGTITVVAPNFPGVVQLQTGNPFTHLVTVPTFLMPGDVGNGRLQYGVNAQIKNYVEAGSFPTIQISAFFAPGSLAFGQLSISGYLVDAR